METWIGLVILAQVLITLFVIWGFMHEGAFIEFEDKIIYAIKMRIAYSRRSKTAVKRQRLNAAVRFTPEVPNAAQKKHGTHAA